MLNISMICLLSDFKIRSRNGYIEVPARMHYPASVCPTPSTLGPGRSFPTLHIGPINPNDQHIFFDMTASVVLNPTSTRDKYSKDSSIPITISQLLPFSE